MKQHTILVADDDPTILLAISCRLENEGYRVFTTQDGYQALAIARREHPDLMILDINMPAGSGVSVQQRIQAIEEITVPPVIYITGNELTQATVDQAEHQSARIIKKPFDAGELLATVSETLAASAAA
ncbi:MAG: response regulator [bacterium]|nr:response regulator [bacterium]